MKIYFIIALSILLAINKLNAQNEKGDLRLERKVLRYPNLMFSLILLLKTLHYY